MAPKWALLVRLMQKERLKLPQKSLILENQAFAVILAILAQTAILVIILASHFRARVDTPKKVPLGVLLRSTRPSYVCIWAKLDRPEARQNLRRPGVWRAAAGCGGLRRAAARGRASGLFPRLA